MTPQRPPDQKRMQHLACWKKGKRNKNETKNIDIQGFDVILQLGVRYRLMAQLLSSDVCGPSTCLIHLRRRP